MKVQFREDYSTVRAMARDALKGKWLQVSLAFLIFNVMTTVIPEILGVLLPQATLTYQSYATPFEMPFSLSVVKSLYTFLLAGPFALGISMYMLNFLRKRQTNLATIFEGFEFLIKAIALQLVMDIFIALWTMLFVIPGIIAGFRYSQAFFILADDPKKGVMQCIRESKELMIGNKGPLFMLNLTFIGWMILAQIPIQMFFVYNTMTTTGAEQLQGILINLLLSLPLIVLNAYVYTATTFFYEIITGHLVQKKDHESFTPFEANDNFQNWGGSNDFGNTVNNEDSSFNSGYTENSSGGWHSTSSDDENRENRNE